MTRPTARQRLAEEVRRYLVVSAYLYVWFVVLMVYRGALLGETGASLLPHGLALGKALVLGKFLLLGDAVRVGTRLGAGPLWRLIVVRSVLLLAVLIVLTVIEELLVGRAHGHAVAQTLAELQDRSTVELVARCLLMLLILLPLVALTEIGRALGPGELRALLIRPRSL